MTIRMIISDIDGTIANRGTISDRTWAAITAVREAGYFFAVATGRTAGLLGPVDAHGYDGIAICDNGALTYDVGNNHVLACELIDSGIVGQVSMDIHDAFPEFLLGVSRIMPEPRSMFSDPRQFESFNFGQGSLEIAEFGQFPAAKMWVSDRDLRSSQIGAMLDPVVGDRAEIAWSSESSGLVEITARGVTKASAVAALATRWGIERHEVVALGDMPNDLAMLEWAGTAIVPANGDDAAKALATEVIGHIEDDGTAAYLESLIR